MSTLSRLRRHACVLLLGGLLAGAAATAAGCDVPLGDTGKTSSAATSAGNINDRLAVDIGVDATLPGVQIQPAHRGPTVNGTAGAVLPADRRGWQFLPRKADGSSEGIWDSILKTSGITPCTSRPGALTGSPGFFDLITEGNSLVLNETGSRATFGYWLTPSNGTRYFLLFSYDHVDNPADGKCLCAAEVFLFGPMSVDTNGVSIPNPPSLMEGLAVAGDGRLLAEVPIEIAKVFNFDAVGKYRDHKKHGRDETVKPGVKNAGEGCLLCHGQNVDSEPQVTRAFPWFTVETGAADGGGADGGAADGG